MDPRDSNDVQDLFGLVGAPDFRYRELARAERDRASDGRWSLLAESVRALRAALPSRRKRPAKAPKGRGEAEHFVVAVVSPTGGAGRSTVTAGAIQALAALGHRAIGLDLDPQNALALSFGARADRRIGIAHAGFGRRDSLSLLVEQDGEGAACIPFGECTSVELDALEEAARKEPTWFRGLIDSIVPPDREIVVVDTPNQRTPWMKQALEIADLVLVVVPPNATALAGLARLDRMLAESLAAEVPVHYLVNRFDARDPLARDVVAGLRLARGERMLPFAIQSDPAVGEAVGLQRTLIDWALGSQVAADFSMLAEWLVDARSAASEQTNEQQGALAAG